MNILDSFYFMFEADASKVQKGADAGKTSADKLKQSLDAADLSADKLAKNFVNMAKNAAGALAGVLALGAIKSLVNDTAAHTAALALQARAMGQNVESMTAYAAAVRAVGGDGNAAAETLSKLRDRFVEMSRFGAMLGPDAFLFKQLGLSAQQMQASIKDPTIALGALADKFQTLNSTQQLYIGKKLGLDQGTIMLLQQGRRAFDEMIQKQKELHAVTQQQADAAIKYKIAQNELSMTFETVKREITTALLPAFTAIVTGLDKAFTWLREHKAVAIAVFGAIGAVVATLLVPPLLVAAGALWAIIAPILAAAAPFIALGIAIGLVIDDIEKFRSGQRSMIGEILNRWPIIGQTAQAIADIVRMAFKLIVDSFRWVGGIVSGEASATWEKFKTTVTKVIDGLLQKFPVLRDVFKAIIAGWKFEVDGLSAVFKTFVDLVVKLFDAIKNAPANVLNWIGRGLAKLTGGMYHDIGDNSAPAPKRPEPEQVARLGNSATGKDIAAKLVASGKWTPEQAAGIAGSFMQESRGKADALNPVSGAYGLGQWLGSRRKDFEQYTGKPLEGSTLDEQIAFFNYETEHKEKRAGDMIRKAQTASEAADAHAKYYERPGAQEINLARREAYATAIYNGQQTIASTNTPLATQPPVSRVANNTHAVTTGDVHIHTPATDPAAHAAAFKDQISRHFNDALDYHDDGVLS